jgi:hypothetical protein
MLDSGLIIFVMALCGQAASTAKPITIDRTLRREPVYPSKPQYCLLLFGPEAKTRVWLVAAGEAFYADRKGNGDLTEPGKRVYSVGNTRVLTFIDPNTLTMWLPVPENERVYQVGDVYDPAARVWYNIAVRRSGPLKTAFFEVMVDVGTRFRQLGRLNSFGDSPIEAPILYFNGAMTPGLFTSELARGPGGTEVEGWIGTKVPAGAEGATTYVVHDTGVPDYVFPVASIEYPGATQPDKPTFQTISLSRRVGLVRFARWTQVPKEAGTGPAKVRLDTPNWNAARVHPAVVEIPIVSPKSQSPQDKNSQ